MMVVQKSDFARRPPPADGLNNPVRKSFMGPLGMLDGTEEEVHAKTAGWAETNNFELIDRICSASGLGLELRNWFPDLQRQRVGDWVGDSPERAAQLAAKLPNYLAAEVRAGEILEGSFLQKNVPLAADLFLEGAGIIYRGPVIHTTQHIHRLMKELGITYQDLADASNDRLSKGTVASYVNGPNINGKIHHVGHKSQKTDSVAYRIGLLFDSVLEQKKRATGQPLVLPPEYEESLIKADGLAGLTRSPLRDFHAFQRGFEGEITNTEIRTPGEFLDYILEYMGTNPELAGRVLREAFDDGLPRGEIAMPGWLHLRDPSAEESVEWADRVSRRKRQRSHSSGDDVVIGNRPKGPNLAGLDIGAINNRKRRCEGIE